mgnify:CR=1 FL=1
MKILTGGKQNGTRVPEARGEMTVADAILAARSAAETMSVTNPHRLLMVNLAEGLAQITDRMIAAVEEIARVNAALEAAQAEIATLKATAPVELPGQVTLE